VKRVKEGMSNAGVVSKEECQTQEVAFKEGIPNLGVRNAKRRKSLSKECNS
jgi:hypothetical protein